MLSFVKRIFTILMFTVAVSACASGGEHSGGGEKTPTWKMPYSDENSQANPDALNEMSIRKEMPHRHAPTTDWDFYYKHCSINGADTIYSATSYDCTGPSF
jgi:hypothetical protein